MMAVNVFSSSVFFRFITIFHQHLMNRTIITRILVHNPSFLLDIRIVVCCHAEKMPLRLLSVAFSKIITALKSYMTCYNVNLNLWQNQIVRLFNCTLLH